MVNCEFYSKNDLNHIGSVFFLPVLLSKFMNFKESDKLIFKNRWRVKKDQIIKSEIFQLNNNVIRHPNSFIKYFN